MNAIIVQLWCAAVLIVLSALVHGFGVAGISHQLGLDRNRRKVSRLHPRTIALLCAVALLLFILHLIEITLFAGFYLAVSAHTTFEQALFNSASAYTTLGQPSAAVPFEWRLVGALEGLTGFLMLGWSTAFFITDMNKLLRQ